MVVHHMFGLNQWKTFIYCSISGSVASYSIQKLWTPLAAIFVAKVLKKFIAVLDPFESTHERIFSYLEKNDILKFFEPVHYLEPVVHVSAHLGCTHKECTSSDWL